MGPRPRLALGAGFALLVTVLTLSSTRTPSVASASAHGEMTRGGTLRLMWGLEPDSVDTARAGAYGGSFSLLNASCAKLFRAVSDPDTGKPQVVPEVAIDYPKITNDGRTYTFELKQTFRFHTGEPVTAWSFARAFNRDANPLMKSPASSRGYLREIIGADAAMGGTAPTVSGVQVLGRYRLQIRLTERTGDFVTRLTMPFFCPIAAGTPIRELGIRKRDKLPPGSGPYYLKERVLSRRIVLERNPYYRGERAANPDRIVWTIESDLSEKVRATLQGNNDFTSLFAQPEAVVHQLVDKYGVNRPGGQFHRSSPTFVNSVFMFNLTRQAFQGSGQAPLRTAINYALDRPALIRAAGYLSGKPSDRLLPATLRRSRPVYPLDGPDLATGRKWASRAVYQPTTLTLYTASYSWTLAAARVFAANLKPLGITVEVKPFELVTLGKKLTTPGEPWDVAWSPRGTLYPDPAGVLIPLIPLLRGTKYEVRIDATNRMADDAARAKAWAKLEADLMRNDPPMAVYSDVTHRALVSRRFGCWSGAPGVHAFRLQENELDLGAVCKK
jgi:ABC-type transport system substrate-binding protein